MGGKSAAGRWSRQRIRPFPGRARPRPPFGVASRTAGSGRAGSARTGSS